VCTTWSVQVGSTTKAFTTMVLGMLVDEGALAWTDPVTKVCVCAALFWPHATHAPLSQGVGRGGGGGLEADLHAGSTRSRHPHAHITPL
jgi:hypothetical protein